jgi:hypothetical protein
MIIFQLFSREKCRRYSRFRSYQRITVHKFYVDSGGFILHSPDMPSFLINSQAARYLVEKGYLEPPTITKDSIIDRGKVDEFAKGVTVAQTSWMIAQFIGRAMQKPHVTPHELITVASTTCSLVLKSYWHISLKFRYVFHILLYTTLVQSGSP